jgi:S-(hydroxymethyl)glutathione dehydrogenase/alcohol dehydrogenase
MKTMRAAVVEDVPGIPVIGDVEVDEPGLGEVLVRTAACGLCHSDLISIDGTVPMFQPPFVLGHEPAGVVEAVGPDVRHLKPGDHVVASLIGFCGHCEACLTGQAVRCVSAGETNRAPSAASRLQRGDEPVGQHCGLGGFAEYLLVGQHNAVRVDETLPLEQASVLGCGVLTGTGAVLNTTPVRAGSTVAVIGCGGVGLAAIQAARLSYAAQIIAIDLDDAKLDLAKRCGATDIVNASGDDPVEAVQTLSLGGVDYAFEAIGRATTVQQGIAMLAMHGTLTLIGLMPPGAEITATGTDFMMGKGIKQSIMGSARLAADVPMLVQHALAGRLDLGVMIENTRPLDDLATAITDLEHGRVLGRTVITF